MVSMLIAGVLPLHLTWGLHGVQASYQLLQEMCSASVLLVFLPSIVLLGHQWVIKPRSAQAAELTRLSASIGQ